MTETTHGHPWVSLLYREQAERLLTMAEVSKQGLRPDDGDTEWLVRQFGRFGRLLKAESSHGDGLPFLADPGTLLGARTLPSQEHSQTRRLLQLSNRQHQEHLCYMQKFSVAHERRLRSR